MEHIVDVAPHQQIDQRILLLRGQRVMIDVDLAALYGVPTKQLNQQVKRNRYRFPEDFMFRLDQNEWEELVTNCDRFQKHKHSTVLPNAFTEHGAIMLASVLNTRRAIDASILVVRAFIALKTILWHNKDLAHKLEELERRITTHDEAIRSLFSAIRQMMTPPETEKRKIGFVVLPQQKSS